MGGCRCTYRNCTVKSDGKTHMFHYPVFEKVRCRQWLINAHRLDFLDLKVSQLKNRVVCQHHFKDENFMNFKKDKLTFDAIPTEDGPYCDPKKYVDISQDSSKLYCIIMDDIENEYINGCDKKANFSMKYGNFLTNLDLMYIEKADIGSNTYKHQNCGLDVLLSNEENNKDKFVNDDDSFAFKSSLPGKSEKKAPTQHKLAVPQYVNSNNVSQSEPIKWYQRFNSGNVSQSSPLDSMLKSNGMEKNKINEQSTVKKEPKIKIISEKKITDPVPITGKFEPVSPNFVLNVSKIRKDRAKSLIIKTENVIEKKEVEEAVESCSKEENKLVETEIDGLVKDEEKSQPSPLANSIKETTFEKPSKVTVLKPRVPPERVEAINKKRKFNMKLRDIIESCLDKLENSDKSMEETSTTKETKNKKRVQYSRSLPKDSSVLNNQDYTTSFLEERMKKMENTLLEKIEQNSKKIIDLKNAYMKASENKPIQTKFDEEIHKKHVFQEISKYLSPNTKSIVYEELFINKYSLGDTNTLPKRKRQR